MIEVSFSPECLQLMRDFAISHERARTTINDRHRGLVTNGVDRIIAIHWFGINDVVFVDSIVRNKEIDQAQKSVRFRKAEAQLVLALRDVLPGGKLTREAAMEQLLSIVAESFGLTLNCHAGKKPSKLYSGPCDGTAVKSTPDERRGSACVLGFNPHSRSCELAWALDIEKYRQWFAESALSGLVLRSPVSSRLALEPLVVKARAYVKQFPQLHPQIAPTSEAIQLGLAIDVLQDCLGKEWCDQYLHDPERPDQF